MKRNLHAGRARRDGCEFRVLTDDGVAAELADIIRGAERELGVA